jgi:hypothetical protein
MTTSEYFQTRFKKGRGKAQASLDLIEAMYTAAESAQPITGRGVGYKLFTAGLIPSMATSETQRVYRLLKQAREQGDIPWEWIVDETREVERVATWSNPAAYAEAVAHSYRRDCWDQQPVRVEVWSEQGTVRGVLAPVLDDYAVGFNVLHGFSSATAVHDAAQSDAERPLIVLYVGDWDPSGMWMSERDLPERLSRYGGDHIRLQRIAITRDQMRGLPSFSASDKGRDKRYNWFVKNSRAYRLVPADQFDSWAHVGVAAAKIVRRLSRSAPTLPPSRKRRAVRCFLRVLGDGRFWRRRRHRIQRTHEAQAFLREREALSRPCNDLRSITRAGADGARARQRAGGGLDATIASPAPAIRALLRPKPGDGLGCRACWTNSREPEKSRQR